MPQPVSDNLFPTEGSPTGPGEPQPTSSEEDWGTGEEFSLDAPAAGSAGAAPALHRQKAGPLAMVETAFLASAASLIWLVNFYFPPGPLLRIFFPVPMALVYLRWGARAAWMSALVSGLLLAVLMGPPRSILFVMPYALMGVQLGWMWQRQASWNLTILAGALLGSLGFFFRVWLISLMLGEDLWVYMTTQITELLTGVLNLLVNWGILGLGVLGQPSLQVVQGLAVVMVFLSNVVYLFTVHIAAWLLLERLGATMTPPPQWVRVLLDE